MKRYLEADNGDTKGGIFLRCTSAANDELRLALSIMVRDLRLIVNDFLIYVGVKELCRLSPWLPGLC